MSTHTNGPWHFYARLYASENHKGFRVHNCDVNIAEVMPLDEDGIEGRANALLIAAAPDLLAQLQRVHDAFAGETFDWEPVRAALAKATQGAKQ